MASPPFPRAADVFSVFAAIVVGLSLLAPSLCNAASSPSSGNVSCSTWAPNSVQNVTVDGFARFGPAEGCGVELINVSVTFFALPQSTIVLDGWSLRGGGSVVIQGPPSAPWSIRDVAVIVTNSVIEASGGPAVSVVLGAGYDASIGGGVALRNVSLYDCSSRLWSISSASNTQTAYAAASASVVSVILASTLDADTPSVTIDRFSVAAVNSDLRSEVTATGKTALAAVASVAAARYGGSGEGTLAWMTVSNSVLHLVRCNATAIASLAIAGVLLTDEAAAVSAVAGLAFGKLSTVGLTVTSTTTAVVHSHVLSTVTAGSNGNTVAGSTVAGVAMGYASNSPVTIADSTTFYLGWSNVSSTCISSTTGTSNSYAGSSVAGVALGVANSQVTITNRTTFYLGWSNATSSSTSNSGAGSSVAGFGVGTKFYNRLTIASNVTFFVAWSNATSTSFRNVDTDNGAGSTVAGVAVGLASSGAPVTIGNNATFCVRWSNANSINTGTSYRDGYAGSSVAGVAVGVAYVNSPVTIANTATFYVSWSIATSSTSSTCKMEYTASTVAGVAVGHSSDANSRVTIAKNTTFYVGWSTATSTTSSRTTSTFAGSSVAGVASTSIALLLALTVTSASTVSACATGSTGAAVSCMMVPKSSSSRQPLCCTASSGPNEAASFLHSGVSFDGAVDPPAPQVTMPFCGRSPSLTQGVGRHHTNTTTLHRIVSTTASRAAARTQSPHYTLALPRVTGSDFTAGRQPSSTVSEHRSTTPTLRVPIETSRTTQSPLSPRPVHQGGVQGLGLGLTPTVVSTVVASGYGSSAVAATLSPTGGNKASAASRLASGAECTAFRDGDLASFPQPYDWSLLPGLTILSLGSDVDSSGASAPTSKVLTTVLLMAMVWAANAV